MLNSEIRRTICFQISGRTWPRIEPRPMECKASIQPLSSEWTEEARWKGESVSGKLAVCKNSWGNYIAVAVGITIMIIAAISCPSDAIIKRFRKANAINRKYLKIQFIYTELVKSERSRPLWRQQISSDIACFDSELFLFAYWLINL